MADNYSLHVVGTGRDADSRTSVVASCLARIPRIGESDSVATICQRVGRLTVYRDICAAGVVMSAVLPTTAQSGLLDVVLSTVRATVYKVDIRACVRERAG